MFSFLKKLFSKHKEVPVQEVVEQEVKTEPAVKERTKKWYNIRRNRLRRKRRLKWFGHVKPQPNNS